MKTRQRNWHNERGPKTNGRNCEDRMEKEEVERRKRTEERLEKWEYMQRLEMK